MKRQYYLVFTLLIFLLLTACQGDSGATAPDSPAVNENPLALLPSDSIHIEPLANQIGEGAKLLTELDSEATGIQFQNELSRPNQRNFTFNGAGAASGDYDNDGFTDLYLVTEEGQNRLYRNLGNGHYEDVTEQAGLISKSEENTFQIAAYFADTDNDNDLDLFLANWNKPDQLYRNNGDGTFTDITEQAGIGHPGGSTTATFADYDRDGYVDLFVATYRPHDFAHEFGTPELEIVDGEIVVPADFQSRIEIAKKEDGGLSVRQLGEPDLLYHNNGDGTFTEVGQEAGIIGGYWGLSAVFSDINNDGWPDLYVTNDFWAPDTFYINNGDGTFSLMDPEYVQNTPMFAMGMDFGDINNDGFMDYFVADMLSRDATLRLTQHGLMDMTEPPDNTAEQIMRNSLFLNNQDGSFSDIAWFADVAASEWTWTAKFADLDLDGYQDLLVTNGMIGDLMDSDVLANINAPQFQNAPAFFDNYPPLITENLAFRNNGDLTFSEVSEAWGFNRASIGHGATFADLDNDGDLDIVVNHMNEAAGYYRNNTDSNRIKVRLNGRQSNSYGLGARVTLTTDEGIQARTMTASGGYLSSHEPTVVFGLGDTAKIEALTVEWPSGHIQSFSANEIELPVNQIYTIVEPDTPTTLPPAVPLGPTSPQFVEVSLRAGLDQVHEEDDFDDYDPTNDVYDDFDVQPLLPRRLSTLGPGVAWGDANDDGSDDLYVAGAFGQTGTLYQNNGDGTFTAHEGSAPPQFEEMMPLWWHNGIHDNPSLLLTFSSLELPDSLLASRPPLGTELRQTAPLSFELGNWSEQSISSGGAMAANDVDGDGDLDLFVGGRVLPGQWPLPASSYLYLNEDGVLQDATAAAAPDLLNLGMATGSMWLDVDRDGDSDLLVATEFGPVRMFRNDGGVLTDTTDESGLGGWTGLWTGLTAGDYNEDGHMDFAAANLGLNTKYHATSEYPTVVYAGDLDEDGTLDIVEAEYVDGVLRPYRERGLVGAEMPFVLAEFDSFRAYAEASIDEIYGDRLAKAEMLTANTLAHTLFINDGKGYFTAVPLPQLAQITAGYGLSTADFDNDGHDDIYLVGNFNYADHETHSYTGGVSYWLRGMGDGTFEIVPSAQSGLFVPYDGRGTAVADYNHDGWVDIVVGINDRHPLLFENQGGDYCALSLRLEGDKLNPDGIGSRIRVNLADGTTTTREVQAGSGYLSQDSTTHLFGLAAGGNAVVQVIWSDGTVSEESNVTCGDLVLTK